MKQDHRQKGIEFAQSLCHGMTYHGITYECERRDYAIGSFDWSDFRFGFLSVIEGINFMEVENGMPDSLVIDSIDYRVA